MDRTTTDHSDSDSGDSWTLIENNSMYADDALDVPDHPAESITAEHHDKDEDTDGISIITDSEPESSSPCEINCEHYPFEEGSKQEDHIPQFNAVNSNLHDVKNHNESQGESNDFLGDSGEKHKTYVHRRNKRLGTVLNIIMLGSVITAAGVAIGHMWGAKTDCSMHTSPNVNKILSNLYKLQEENAYLWNKVKELTALNNHQCQIKNQQKATMKQNKCKKIFEEPLINNDSKKVTKCVDDKFINDGKLLNKQMDDAAQDNEFLLEVGSFKNAYQDNQKWFDDETAQGSSLRPLKKIKPRHISTSKNNLEKEKSLNEIIYIEENNQNEKKKSDEYLNETEDLTTGRKSYADSVHYDKYIHFTNKESKESKAFKPDYRIYDNKNLLKHGSEIDFSLNDRDKLLNVNNNNWFEKYNRLKEEYGYEFDLSKQGKTTKTNFDYLNHEYLFNDFNTHKRHHNIKKRESNKTFKVANKDFDTNEISKENSEEREAEDKLLRSIKDKTVMRESFKTKNKTLKIKSKEFDRTKITEGKEYVRNIKDKNQKKGTKSEYKEAFQAEYKTLNKKPDVKYDSNEEIVRNMKDSALKKTSKMEDNKTHKNKGNKKETTKQKNDTEERNIKDQNLNDIQNKNQARGIKTKSFYTNKNPSREVRTEEDLVTNIKDTKIKDNSEQAFTMKSTDIDLNETTNNENNRKKRVATKNNYFNKDEKAKEDNIHYQRDISDEDEDLKKDNRYIGQKQKQERKKFDRQQSHKKVKRRNKYEQWEMKGGLFKDYDDISMSSSQDIEYSFNTPNVDVNHHPHMEGSNSKIGNIAANLNHDHKDYPKSTHKGNVEDDQMNWLDKRAAFRTEARLKLDQESVVNNGVNAAGWYFRRMRKREQSREAADKSTYRKLLKRKF